jgi:hypothetical protein
MDRPFRGMGGGTGTEELKDKASQLTQTARERAMSTIDQQKQQVSGLLDRLAETMTGDRIGGYAADYARRGADYLRRTSADEMWSSARSNIRSRPGVLLSACFVAGLAVARVLRRDRGGEERWSRASSERESWRGPETWSETRTWPEGRGFDEPRP